MRSAVGGAADNPLQVHVIPYWNNSISKKAGLANTTTALLQGCATCH